MSKLIPFNEATGSTKSRIKKIREQYANDLPGFCKDRLMIQNRLSKVGGQLIPFELNPGQLALHNTIERIKQYNLRRAELTGEEPSEYPIHLVVLKSRRVGFSTYIAARGFWRCEMEPMTEALIMAHHQKATWNLSGIQRRFHYHFQDGNKFSLRYDCSALKSGLIWDPMHGSSVTLQTGGSTGGGSRSFGYNFLHISEEAHFAESDEVATALAAKTPYCEIYEESTANGEGNIFHENWENARWIEDAWDDLENGVPDPDGWSGAFKFFWPWIADPANRLPLLPGEEEQILSKLDDTEQELVDVHGATAEQLKWRRRTIANDCTKQNKMTPEDYFCQEWPTTPEEAFIAAGKTVFDQKRLAELMAQARDNKPQMFRIHRRGEKDFELRETRYDKNANIFVYQDKQPGHAYIGGVDAAEGLEHGDDSVMSIFDRNDGMSMTEVCRLVGKIPAEELGEICAWFGPLYNDCFFVVERNAPGNATCSKLVKLEYPHQYQTMTHEKVGANSEADAWEPGFRTTRQSKAMIVELAASMLRDGFIVLRHKEAITQWKIFQNEDGKLSAPKGKKDDCVMADMLACFGQFHPGAAPYYRPIEDDTDELANDGGVSFAHKMDAFWKERMQRSRKEWSRRNLEREERQAKLRLRDLRRGKANPFA